MKKIILGIAVLATGILTQAQLQNPDFEQAENNSPSAWKIEPNDLYLVKTDDVVKHSGKNAIQISNTADASASMQPFSQMFSIQGSGFRKVRLSGYVRSENITGNIALYAYIKNGEKITIDKGNSETQNHKIKANKDWKEYSLEFVVDDNAKNFLFGAFLSGNGKVWFDDFSVSEVPFSEKTASKESLAYIDDFKNIIKKNSIFKDKINWPSLDNHLQIISKGMETVDDTSLAIQYIMKHLKEAGDNHSFIDSKESFDKKSTSNPTAIEPESQLLDQNIGYVMVPAFSSLNKEVGSSFAEKIQSMIRKLDADHPIKGWIVDLRKNMGGNMHPMIAGLGPLTGEGVLGYFADSKKKTPWKYANGTCGAITVPNPYVLKDPKAKIAVLMGPRTASSGEATAISLIGKDNVKTFGQPSAGYTSANRGFKLSDGRNLLLAVSYEMDRTGKEYKEKIQPDIPVAPSENANTDAEVAAAIQWIKE